MNTFCLLFSQTQSPKHCFDTHYLAKNLINDKCLRECDLPLLTPDILNKCDT